MREAAAKAAESDDPKAFCRTMVTDHYVQVVFHGDRGACVDSDDAVPDEPGKARVGAVALDPKDESRAEAMVTISGGELGGTSGHVTMVEDGDGWKLDALGDDYLRSTFMAAVEKTDEGALANEMIKACFKRNASSLDDETIRRLAFAGYRSRKAEVTEALLPIAEKCPHALADYGAREFTRGLVAKGKSPAYVHCLQEEIRFFLELTDIVPDLLKPKPSFASVRRSKASSRVPRRTASSSTDDAESLGDAELDRPRRARRKLRSACGTGRFRSPCGVVLIPNLG